MQLILILAVSLCQEMTVLPIILKITLSGRSSGGTHFEKDPALVCNYLGLEIFSIILIHIDGCA